MPRKKAASKKQRFTLWLPEKTVTELDQLRKVTGKASVAEVVREAVDVYRSPPVVSLIGEAADKSLPDLISDAVRVYSSLLQAAEDGVRLYFEDTKTGETGRIWLLPGPPPTDCSA